MKEDVLDVLLYIFENYQEEESSKLNSTDNLVEELEEVGFTNNEIERALDWLDGLVDARSADLAPIQANPASLRVFTEEEEQLISVEGRGFLLFLEQTRVLDTHAREMVIDRLIALSNGEEADMDRIKWVVMMVLFNMPGREGEFAWVENMDLSAQIH